MQTQDYSNFSKLIGDESRKESEYRSKLTPNNIGPQPVHVVYGGAHLFSKEFKSKLTKTATQAFMEVAKSAENLNRVLQKKWTTDFAEQVFAATVKKLEANAVEDYRIDFEDGYGTRSDEEEDKDAFKAANSLAICSKDELPSHQIGFRIKALQGSNLQRSLRTLHLFAETLLKSTKLANGPANLIVTLPKVMNAVQVRVLNDALHNLESKFGINPGFFKIELIIETPQALFDSDGRFMIPMLIAAANRRCVGLHFGVYDFTSELGLNSAGQSIDQFSCDMARFFMQVAAGMAEGLFLSDGVINHLPLPTHRAKKSSDGKILELTSNEKEENIQGLEEAWRINYNLMTRSLQNGFNQGWDLHPAQIGIRHLANIVFVLGHIDDVLSRLKKFQNQAGQASRVGKTFDDRASVLGLLKFVERALAVGGVVDQKIKSSGLDLVFLKGI